MKKQVILLIFLCVAIQVFAQKPNTVITGKVMGLSENEWIYLSTFNNNYKDSVHQTDKGFKFELDIPDGEGAFYILRIGKSLENISFFYLEKGKLHISSNTSSLRDAKYSGGKLADYYNLYHNRPEVDGMGEVSKQLMEARESSNEEELKRLSAEYTAKRVEQKELDKSFVLKHKNSTGIVYPLFFSLRDRNNWDELESLLQQVSVKAKNNIPVKEIEYSIKTDKLTGIGRAALPFSQQDTAGNKVSLEDFRGKYVLIDFWASWCVPCRVENPNVVAAYQQYKNKNFTVLGISFDNPGQHGRWMTAIHDDNLYWTQLSDLKGWKNEVGVLYDIKSIPSNLLIDPNGVIVAKNLRGEKLEEKLAALLGEPLLDGSTFVLTGKMENEREYEWLHLRYEDVGGTSISDSVRIFNGVFSYIGSIDSPTEVWAYFSKEKDTQQQAYEQYTSFYVEPAVITLTGSTASPKDMVVSGSKTQDEKIVFDKLFKMEMDALRPLNEEYNKKNTEYIALKKHGAEENVLNDKLAELEELKDKMGPLQTAIRDKNVTYIKQNPNSYISMSQLRYYVSSLKLDELEAIYDQTNNEIRQTSVGKALAQEIAQLKAGSPGSPATNFADTDINGKPLQLTDYRGKYVLLDFWASWCIPCRKGNPHLLELYGKYSKKGFEIIGISDDDSNLDAWRKAVEKDGIGVWKHILRGLKRTEDGFDRSNDISDLYGIHTLPTKILIDPNGIIIGRYGSGGENDGAMDKKLKEIFM